MPKNGGSNEKTTENEIETGFVFSLQGHNMMWRVEGLGYVGMFGIGGLNCWGGD